MLLARALRSIVVLVGETSSGDNVSSPPICKEGFAFMFIVYSTTATMPDLGETHAMAQGMD